MTIAVYLPLIVTAVFGALGAPVARRISPVPGAVALAVLAAVGALGTVWTLALLAGTLIDEFTPAPAGDTEPVPDVAGLIAAVLLVAILVRVVDTLRRQLRASAMLTDACAGDENELTVLVDGTVRAFAVPPRRAWGGRPARSAHVVVTEGMLRALTNGQRRVLFAHERAHLALRHDRLRLLADLAAAANPLLAPVSRATTYLCERSADERAAAYVGDRGLVASAVATAALAGGGSTAPFLAFGGLRVTDRVHALAAPPPSRRRAIGWTVVAVGIAVIAADIHATSEFVSFLSGLLPF